MQCVYSSGCNNFASLRENKHRKVWSSLYKLLTIRTDSRVIWGFEYFSYRSFVTTTDSIQRKRWNSFAGNHQTTSFLSECHFPVGQKEPSRAPIAKINCQFMLVSKFFDMCSDTKNAWKWCRHVHTSIQRRFFWTNLFLLADLINVSSSIASCAIVRRWS